MVLRDGKEVLSNTGEKSFQTDNTSVVGFKSFAFVPYPFVFAFGTDEPIHQHIGTLGADCLFNGIPRSLTIERMDPVTQRLALRRRKSAA